MSALWMGVLVGLFVACGQSFFALLVRSLDLQKGIGGLAIQVLASPWLYAASCAYVVGIGIYAALLRNASLVQANVIVIVIVVLVNAGTSFLIGERLGATQWAGVVLAVAGVALLKG